MRIAITLQKDYWRDRQIQFWRETQANAVDVDSAIDSLPSEEPSPEAQVIAREQATRVWGLVECLSMHERGVFLLRYVEDLEMNDIGRRSG